MNSRPLPSSPQTPPAQPACDASSGNHASGIGDGEGLLIERIDALLPQTQCQRCGFPACKPYATAIVRNEADINQCPPGGAAGIHRLADLLGREFKPLSPIHGSETPKQVVAIDESRCIGCTLCIQACPVDAIVGASKLMHTVIADHCTGCELCIPPCPVDCIDLIVAAQPDREKRETARSRNHDDELSADEKRAADAARKRYEFRQFRLARDQLERAERLALIAQNKRKATAAGNPENPERALIAAALERVRKNARHTE